MAAYIIAELQITDPEGFELYRSQVRDVIAAFGGRYVVRGGATTTLEGPEFTLRTVVLEFPDMNSLVAFWDSEAYAPLKALRQASATARIRRIEGV